MNDDQLHQVLRRTPAQVSVPDSFGREVWARIEAESSLTAVACVRRLGDAFFGWLARPVPAFATVALFLVFGAVLGVQSHDESVNAPDELAYVESINPLLRTHPGGMP